MGDRPHLFHNLPLPSSLLHRYQIILLGGRGTWVRRSRYAAALGCGSNPRPLDRKSDALPLRHAAYAAVRVVCAGVQWWAVGVVFTCSTSAAVVERQPGTATHHSHSVSARSAPFSSHCSAVNGTFHIGE